MMTKISITNTRQMIFDRMKIAIELFACVCGNIFALNTKEVGKMWDEVEKSGRLMK